MANHQSKRTCACPEYLFSTATRVARGRMKFPFRVPEMKEHAIYYGGRTVRTSTPRFTCACICTYSSIYYAIYTHSHDMHSEVVFVRLREGEKWGWWFWCVCFVCRM